MAAGVPPPPLNSPSGSYYWLEWYTNLTNFLNGTNIPWSNLNFSGSNITDILTRNHNDLQNIQGGTVVGSVTTAAYHLKGPTFIGTTAALPTGWTIVTTGTTHTITHGLSISNPYVVMAVAGAAGGTVQYTTTATNSFTIVMTSAVLASFILSEG